MENEIVPVRMSPLDKAALVELADRLQRNRSDTVRLIVREALEIIRERDAQSENKGKTRK